MWKLEFFITSWPTEQDEQVFIAIYAGPYVLDI